MEIAQTADYALRVLLTLEERDGQSIAELTQRLGLGRSVVQRIVVTLHRRSFLLKGAKNTYWLGPGLLAVSAHLPHELAVLSRGIVGELAMSTREMVVVEVPDGDEGLVVASRNGSDLPLRIEYEAGFRHPLTRGATGHAMLAFLDDSDTRRLAPRGLRSELAAIRAQGYATTAGEVRPDMMGVAVPILTATQEVLGAMAIIAPSARADRLEGAAETLTAAARRVAQAYDDVGRQPPAEAMSAR